MFGKPNIKQFVEAVKTYKELKEKLKSGEQEPLLVGPHYTITKHGVYLLQRGDKRKLSFFTKEIVKDKIQVGRWSRWSNKAPQNRYKKTKIPLHMFSGDNGDVRGVRYKRIKTKVTEPYLPKRFLLNEGGCFKIDQVYSIVEKLHHITQRPVKDVSVESMERYNQFAEICKQLETHCSVVQTLQREPLLIAAYKQAKADENKLKTFDMSSHRELTFVDSEAAVVDLGATLKETLRESRGN